MPEWFAVFEKATGRLESVGTVLSPRLPAHLDFKSLGFTRPDVDTQMWDESSRSYIPRPPKILVDRVTDLENDPDLAAVWTRLTAPQQTALRGSLVHMLGRKRFRNPNKSVVIE